VHQEADAIEVTAARRFVERLAQLGAADRLPALAPILHRDPYLSAWTNVEAALGNAPARAQGQLAPVLLELDAAIERLDLLPSLREAAHRAVRALVARRWLLTQESVTFVYQPFESAIPIASLEP
jgi:hypothetical protein